MAWRASGAYYPCRQEWGGRAYGGPPAGVDFFISYTAADRAWAEWIAWQLESERYTTVLQAWDFAPGENFVVRMRDALEQADRTIALLSEAYLASRYSTDEWTGAFLHDESGQERLLPVRVEACALPRRLATRIYIDLAGASRPTAKQRLLEGVKRGRRPDREPPGPWGTTGGALRREQEEPRFPAQGPSITNLPRRNLNFTGRSELLEGLHSTLQGTVASGPKVPLASSKVEPLPAQTAARSAQSNQSWHRRWRSRILVEDAGLSGRQM